MTPDGEWEISNGDFTTVAGAAAVPQGIQIRVSMFQGECELDESIGVPWLDDILIKGDDPLLVRALLSEAIAETPDVTNVVGADLQQDNTTRDASIAYTVDTVYSQSPMSSTLDQP